MENLKDTLFKFLKLNTLVDNLSGYVETRVKLIKIEIREDVAKVLSKGLVQIVILLFLFLFLLFFSLGLAQYLNAVMANPYAGYWVVSGFYFLIFLIFLIFRKKLDHRFAEYFAEMIKRKEEE